MISRALSSALGIFIVAGVVTIGLVYTFAYFMDQSATAKVVEFYQKELRASLFVGFLTVAAFLFSLKTFMVVNMKENVYDQEFYGEMVEERKQLDPKITRYGPLKNFSDLLFWSVLISFIAAVAQFSVGIVAAVWAVAICVAFALWSIVMIFISLFHMQKNLRTWFDLLEGR